MDLLNHLKRLTRRHVAIQLTAAIGWGLVIAVVFVLAGAWLDLLWELPAAARIGVLAIAPAVLLGYVGARLIAAWRNGQARHVAQRLDNAGQTSGQILTGVDLALQPSALISLTAGLATIAVSRASDLVRRAPVGRALPLRPALNALAVVAAMGVAVACLSLVAPRLFWAQWLRFADPFAEHAPYAQLQIHVEPGDVTVVYGDTVEIRASVEGGSVARLDLMLQPEDATGSGVAEPLPMFPESDGRWRATITRVTASAQYHVRAHAGRSDKHQISVITVPQIAGVRFKVTPPAYTNRSAWEGALPQGGLAVLPNTKVQLWARSNRPLSGGTVRFETGAATFTRLLAPASTDVEEVSGEFEIEAAGKLEVQVTDVTGQGSTHRFAAPVTLLRDERPAIRLVEPAALSFATPTAVLPVLLSAEDDYGLASLQIFRSLNDSRSLPLDVPLAKPAPLRHAVTVSLPLASYGLSPGDEIKLFGQAEDTDPAGPNGAESAVATIKIISQEEYERMVLVQQAFETLSNKYRQALRRTGNVADDVERLRKKTKDLSPEEAAKEMAELAERIRAEAEAIRKLAQRELPYDLDKQLQKYLKDTSSRLKKLEDRARAMAKGRPSADDIAAALEEMARDLGQQRDELDREVVEPLERLEAAFPLMEDAARFVRIVEQQKALAERLRSLAGEERPQDVAVVRRLSDGKTQQEALRKSLLRLLDDIEDHLTQLPDIPEFVPLRADATQFLKLARGIGAIEAMLEAEKALGDLSGRRGHPAAKRAAELLESLLKQADDFAGGGGLNAGRTIPRFAPTLHKLLGDTLAQMLGQRGLLPGQGQGQSSVANAQDAVGLYGGLDAMDLPRGPASTRGNRPGDAKGKTLAAGRNPSRSGGDAALTLPAPGAAEAAVPSVYRRRVAEYFRRIAEETAK